MRTTLQNVREAFYDATFFVTPKQFYQVFTIFALIANNIFLAIPVLMTSKTEYLYEGVLRKIQQEIPLFMPEKGMSDFELASRNAMKLVFPNISLSGCSFHFLQAVLRNARVIGLTNAFRTNPVFKALFKRLMNIHYLPENHIGPMFDLISNEESGLQGDYEKKMWKKLLKYFRRFWIELIGPQEFSVFAPEIKHGVLFPAVIYAAELALKLSFSAQTHVQFAVVK